MDLQYIVRSCFGTCMFGAKIRTRYIRSMSVTPAFAASPRESFHTAVNKNVTKHGRALVFVAWCGQAAKRKA